MIYRSAVQLVFGPRMKSRSKVVTRAEQQSKSIVRGKKPIHKAKKKKKKANLGGDEASKPKKPPTAFFYFLEDFRKTYQVENPDVKSMREIGKACGEKWKTMTYEEKVAYYDVATEKRAEFEKAVSEYTKRKESGQLSEESYDLD